MRTPEVGRRFLRWLGLVPLAGLTVLVLLPVLYCWFERDRAPQAVPVEMETAR